MRKIRVLCLLAALAAARWAAAGSANGFAIEVAEDLGSVAVTVPAGVGALRIHDRALVEGLTSLENLVRRDRRLNPVDATRPMRYTVTLTHGARQRALARFHAGVRFTDWSHWLATPVAWPRSRRLRLEIGVPGGGSATAPFELVSVAPGRVVYDARPILLGHGGFVAFGAVDLRVQAFDQGALAVAVIGDAGGDGERFHRWVRRVGDAVAATHGTLPAPACQVVVVPAPFPRGEVPWAHVRRGGGSGVVAYVNRDADDADVLEDWTLFHELAHLYHPYLGDAGRWVGEGFASYFQNLYRARAGVVSADYAWRRLVAGLERGARETRARPGRTVTQGGRMRTYWTGAALALRADAELRGAFDGRVSLASVMGRFAATDLPAMREWSPREYMERLDALSGSEVFTTLFDEYVRSTRFPDVPVQSTQGISIMGG